MENIIPTQKIARFVQRFYKPPSLKNCRAKALGLYRAQQPQRNKKAHRFMPQNPPEQTLQAVPLQLVQLDVRGPINRLILQRLHPGNFCREVSFSPNVSLPLRFETSVLDQFGCPLSPRLLPKPRELAPWVSHAKMTHYRDFR
jgi:hypothetical protein